MDEAVTLAVLLLLSYFNNLQAAGDCSKHFLYSLRCSELAPEGAIPLQELGT